MRLLPAWYPIYDTLTEVLPLVSAAQRRQLTVWLAGTLEAGSSCEAAVVQALHEATADAGLPVDPNTIRQDLRELFRDAAEKRTPQGTALAVTPCFPALLAYVLRLLNTRQLALALDATNFQDRLTAIVVSVVYRGRAIPVAWEVREAERKGAWMPLIVTLLAALVPVVPTALSVLVLADEGLFSPTLLRTVRDYGWIPILRGHLTTTVTLAASQRRCQAGTLVAGPGQAWVGRIVLFKTPTAQLRVSLLVVWGTGHEAPWVLITSAAPREVGVYWYALRCWIECGFRDLKALGWQWERTQRRRPARVARHWLVLALATIWVLAAGTQAEEAQRQGVARALVQPPAVPPAPVTGQRAVSVFQRGKTILRRQLARDNPVIPHWLCQEAWPEPPPDLRITYDDADRRPPVDAPHTALPQ